MGSSADSTAAPAERSNQRGPTEILWLGAAAGVCCCWLLLRRRTVCNALLQCLSSCNQLRFPLWRPRQRRPNPAQWKAHRSGGNTSSEEGSESDADEEAEDDDAACASSLDYKMVLCVRQDLGMSKGKIAAQCGHATLGAYLRAKKRCSPDCLKLWAASGQKKIAVKVKDETELEHLQWEANKRGVNAYAVHDAGRTQVPSGTVTVLAVGPAAGNAVDAITGHLRLL